MYNIYVEQKKRELQNIENQEKINKMKFDIRHENKLNRLLKNYNKRIKEFVVEMIEENPKIKIKDYTNKIVNSREEYLMENDKKIKGRRGFLFGSFKTEKDRIKKALEDNCLLNGSSIEVLNQKKNLNNRLYDNYRSKSVCNNDKLLSQSSIQPSKYAASLIKDDKKLPYVKYNPKNLYNLYSSNTNQIRGQNKILTNLERERQLLNCLKCNRSLISSNSKISSRLNKYEKSKKTNNFKTYFRALESITLNHPNGSEPPSSSVPSSNKKKHFHNKIVHNSLSVSNIKKQAIDEEEEFGKITFDFQDEEEKEQKINKKLINEVLINNRLGPLINNRINFGENDIKKEKEIVERNQSDDDNLNILRKMAFEHTEEEKEKDDKRLYLGEDLRKEDDKVVINGESFYMGNQMDIISNKILNKCNVFHNKNKNSMDKLIAGGGKLMITNGMSVKEFKKKYNV